MLTENLGLRGTVFLFGSLETNWKATDTLLQPSSCAKE